MHFDQALFSIASYCYIWCWGPTFHHETLNVLEYSSTYHTSWGFYDWIVNEIDHKEPLETVPMIFVWVGESVLVDAAIG